MILFMYETFAVSYTAPMHIDIKNFSSFVAEEIKIMFIMNGDNGEL